MSIKQVKVSTQAKEQLIRLKARTGIAHFHFRDRRFTGAILIGGW